MVNTEIADASIKEKYNKLIEIQPEMPYRDDSNPYEWNEMGLSELFALLYAKEARYCPEQKSWYTYYGGKWCLDAQGILVGEKIKEFMRILRLYSVTIRDIERKEQYVKFLSSAQDRRFRNRLRDDAQGGLNTPSVLFDANPYCINCKNGTYDLKTNEFREFNPEDYITRQTNFNHTVNHSVKSKRWEDFIFEVCEGNADKIDYLQRALGYSIIGTSVEECMFILYGRTTRNGKSTLLNTIEFMMGDYSSVVNVGMICRDKNASSAESASPMLAALKGKRFVTMSESDEYGKFDEEKIKQYTGGESITARALYSAPITFRPQFTMWLSCNDLPQVSDKSLFTSNRLRVVTFDKHFSDEEQDKHLKERLLTDESMSGIFMWLIIGYQNYVKHGLTMSVEMQSIIKSYEQDNDLVLQYLLERVVKAENTRISSKDLYKDFIIWCRNEHLSFMSGKRFANELSRHPEWYDKITTTTGSRLYEGMTLKSLHKA